MKLYQKWIIPRTVEILLRFLKACHVIIKLIIL